MKKAEATRTNILQKAFELIYIKGYQNTSIDEILDTTHVTKGAFYYHFKTKDEMGIAIINEVFKPTINSSFTGSLQNGEDPLEAIYNFMDYLLMKNEFFKVEYGCPVANLTQEMAPLNASFSKALNELTQQGIKVISSTIERGKEYGFVRKDVNAKQVTMFIMSGYQGVRNLGKLGKSRKIYSSYLKELKSYLDNLK